MSQLNELKSLYISKLTDTMDKEMLLNHTTSYLDLVFEEYNEEQLKEEIILTFSEEEYDDMLSITDEVPELVEVEVLNPEIIETETSKLP